MMRAANHVGVVDNGDWIYVAALPDGPILVLDGPSALAWRTACALGRSAVIPTVAEATGEDVTTIAPHLDAFIDDLVHRGLLVCAEQ